MATMAQVASDRGYAATRVSDVLKPTGISRRTFYVHFGNRNDCFFAAYDAIVSDLERLIGATSGLEGGLEPSITRMLAHFSHQPAHARVFLIEILSARPDGPERHERSMTMLASHIAACARWQPGPCESLGRADAADALVGAMARLIQRALLNAGEGALPSLAPTLLALGTAVAPGG
jgi:AcrR family transcriptional regulator